MYYIHDFVFMKNGALTKNKKTDFLAPEIACKGLVKLR